MKKNFFTLLNNINIQKKYFLEELKNSGQLFSPFKEDLIQMNEMAVSKLLAMLFNPKASHSQRTLFLEGFLKLLNNTDENHVFADSSLKVFTERVIRESNSKRRIDIGVTGRDFVLCIENKIHAGDEEHQLDDYLKWLLNTSNGRKTYLVYLTKDGKEPPEESLSKENRERYSEFLTFLSWPTVLEMLEKRSVKLPEKLKVFILDFCSALRNEINEVRSMEAGMEQMIANWLVKASFDELVVAQILAKTDTYYDEMVCIIVNDWSKRLESKLQKSGVKGRIVRYEINIRKLKSNETYDILNVYYDSSCLVMSIFVPDYFDKKALSWGIWMTPASCPGETWEEKFEFCKQQPIVAKALKEHGVYQEGMRCITNDTYDKRALPEPELLEMLRNPDKIFLEEKVLMICKEIEGYEK